MSEPKMGIYKIEGAGREDVVIARSFAAAESIALENGFRVIWSIKFLGVPLE